MCRNTVFKENNNLVLSGKDYLESFLVGSLSVGALHAKSTAIGLSSDVIGSIYKMKNSKGQHLPNETVKAYLLNNATDSDIQKIDTWGKDIKAEDIDKMTDDLGRIASAKIGSLTYGDISKATAKMDKGQVIDFYYQVMNSPEYKSQTEEMKKQSAVAMDEGEGVKVNTTLDNLKSNIEITDNTLNKTVSNINENTNKEDVINNETLTSSQNNSIDTDSEISENSQVINDAADNVKTDNQANNTGINAEGKTNYSIINQESQNNAVGNENSIANGDGMGYKGGEGNLYSQDFEIPEDILKTKPQNSRIPKGWFDIGGKISVDKNNTWTYIGPQNQTVTYNNNYAYFKGSGYVKQEVNIGEFKSRPDDCRRANKLAPNGPKSPDSVWHHNEDEQTMQEINKIIHEMFTHKGGFSKMKKNK